MARTARLLELLIRVQSRPGFTAQEMADELGVSRRTILRDLRTLAEMGVPLRGSPGPGGGFTVPRGSRRLSPSLTVDEALAVIVAYEALQRYAVSPFAAETLSVITKLRGALPADIVGEIDTRHQHVAVLEPVREVAAPFLKTLFDAAVARQHLTVTYDSAAGLSERVIFPYGVFASRGYWFCACFDERRDKLVTLRADRFRAIAAATGRTPLPHVAAERWIAEADESSENTLRLRATVTPAGTRNDDLTSLFGQIQIGPDDIGIIESTIPPRSVDFFAGRFLAAYPDAIVASPPELIAAIRAQAEAALAQYTAVGAATDMLSSDHI